MIDWEELRKEHTRSINGVYLNSPANGLISYKTIAHENRETEQFLSQPGKYRIDFMLKTVPRIKFLLSELINAPENTIALIQNFSIGLNFLVNSIPSYTKIGLLKNDYPSLTMPFEVNNCEIHWLEFEKDHTLDLQKIESFIKSEKIELFALSHCQWLTGYLSDIESIGAICKQYNCLFLVDATQSIGAANINVQKCNIDILGASCYKWPLAGFGNGFLFIREEVLKRFQPQTAGFNSYTWENGTPLYSPGIKSYEPGHHDHNAFNRLEFALKRISEIGIENIETKINELMDYLIEKLHENKINIIGDFLNENRLGIIAIASKPDLFRHLLTHNIEVSERGGNIRLGVHYYNTESDIDSCISAILSL